MRTRMLALLAVLPLAACGSGADNTLFDAGLGGDGGGSGSDASGPRADAGSSSAPQFAELWYSVDDRLVYIELNPADGRVVNIRDSSLGEGMPPGQNAITMLDDGSLVLARLSTVDNLTHFYLVKEPPRDGSPTSPVSLGLMPDSLMLEGLYTDCDGRLYGMDTGADNTSSEGNRLLRFTGDYLGGDFSYAVVSDLASADVADIDDMGPGITSNEISDNPGLAIDTGDVYVFDYETGTGSLGGQGGTFGIHALGGPLFDDDRARLYVLNRDAELFEMDPEDHSLSGVLATGPQDVDGISGHSGLAGPLTDCDSGFQIE